MSNFYWPFKQSGLHLVMVYKVLHLVMVYKVLPSENSTTSMVHTFGLAEANCGKQTQKFDP
jgi:hypothetical protein